MVKQIVKESVAPPQAISIDEPNQSGLAKLALSDPIRVAAKLKRVEYIFDPQDLK